MSRSPDTTPPDTVFCICAPDGLMRPSAPPEIGTVISHGRRNERLIALTFDACSTSTDSSGYDAAITSILLEMNVPATLFLGGKWMEEHPGETKLLASHFLFELGNHTYSHPHLTRIADDSIRWQLAQTEKVLESLTGKRTHLFRAPYGEIDERVVRIGASEGLRTVQYDLASGDPDRAFTKDRLARYVIRSCRNGSIIVMHINNHGWHTAEALPTIIDSLRALGFSFVTVSTLNHLHDSRAE
ncbi:MAG: polysaccharide deacetylase family protein [Ignavibacteriales bacterium]|nr:polysaccharide deacetylase family protein [Ignavibacteriales bacterium]